MAGLDDAGKVLNAVAQTFGNGVGGVINAVADAVTDMVETAGNGIQDGLIFIGHGLKGKAVFYPKEGAYSGFFAWLGGVVAGLTNLVGAAVKGSLGIVGGVTGGIIKVVFGFVGALFSGDWSVSIMGIIDMGSGLAGAIISTLGTLASLLQRISFLQNNERTLTKAEIALLRTVFKDSISLYNIRLIEGWSGIFGITTHGAFTLNNTIYLNAKDISVHPETLVHECLHVWQYQNLGVRYIMDALGAQWIYGREPGGIHDAYDWTDELARGKTKWEDFNKEAQATLIHEIWDEGSLNIREAGKSLNTIKKGSGAFYEKNDSQENYSLTFSESFISKRDGADYTRLAIAAVKSLRGYWNFRLSHFI